MDKETKLKTLYFYLDLREKKIPTLVFSLKKIKEKEKFNIIFII